MTWWSEKADADEAIGVIAEYGTDRIVTGAVANRSATVTGLTCLRRGRGSQRCGRAPGRTSSTAVNGTTSCTRSANGQPARCPRLRPGYDIAYPIVHDPARLHGCEQVIRLSPEEASDDHRERRQRIGRLRY